MISISPFFGEIPKISSKLLPDSNAAVANQCDLSSMSLRPERSGNLTAYVKAGSKSIYKHPLGYWFSWDNENVSAALSPLNNDVWDRLYWTGDGPPKMATSTMAGTGGNPTGLTLGIPAPSSAISVSAPDPSDEEEGYDITVVYTCTFVSEYGEEGPPAPASAVITKRQSAAVSLTNIPSVPTGGHSIAIKRIYRAEASGSYLLVAELPATAASWNDTVLTEELGETLPSLEWDMPDPRMTGLINIGNGVMAGWFDNTLCFCEPYRPHAWPVGYQLGFESDIVGVAPVSGGLIVVTQQAPWLVSGVSPAAMVMSKLDVHLGAVSRKSVVDMGEYAIYASEEGLVAVGGNQAQIITQDILTRDQWQQYNPSSIFAFRLNANYLAFFERKSGERGAFLLHPSQGIIHYNTSAISGVLDPVDGEVYTVDQDGAIEAWARGDLKPYTWKSKVFSLQRRSTMPVAKIDGAQTDQNPVALTVISDGKVLCQKSVSNDLMIRLPAGRYRDWQIEITGTAEVFSIQVATSPAFLR